MTPHHVLRTVSLLAVLGCSAAERDVSPVFPRCAEAGVPVAVGLIQQPALTEASGLAVGARDGTVLWTHNDKGGEPELFAIDLPALGVRRVPVPGVVARDWEDIASGVLDGRPMLFVADTGNNDQDERDVAIVRLEEPARDAPIGEAAVLPVRWSHGIADVEGLAFDSVGRQLVLASKQRGTTVLFTMPADSPPGVELTPMPLGELPLPDAKAKVTALDLNARALYLRTEDYVLAFSRQPGESLAGLLTRAPCLAPAPPEPDGEALGGTKDGYFTLSEGRGPTLYKVELRGY